MDEKVIFDSDIVIDFFRGIKGSVEALESIPKRYRQVTSITLMEVYRGARDKNERSLFKDFFRKNFVAVLHVTSRASRCAVDFMEKYSLGFGLRRPDALIAGIAITNGAKLVTGNERHFRFVEGLRVEMPAYQAAEKGRQ